MKNCTSNIGKVKRFNRIFSINEKCLIIPLDDNLISGPETKIKRIDEKLSQIVQAAPSAILAFQGTLCTIENNPIPTILNLTASTINSNHTNKVLVESVQTAIKLGVDAVAIHINLTSIYESSMLSLFGRIAEECDLFGIPLLAIVYPRGEVLKTNGVIVDQNYSEYKRFNTQKYTDLVSHCVRVAFELGADIIKTQYTGSVESFSQVIDSASKIPVLIAGGNEVEIKDLFKMTEEAMIAGASGACIGRNVFCRRDSDKIINCLKKIIFDNMDSQNVYEYYKMMEG